RRRHRRRIPLLRRSDRRLLVRAPARRHAALRQRLFEARTLGVGAADPALGRTRRRLLLFRQRRQGARALRRAGPATDARRPRYLTSEIPTPSSPCDRVLASPPCASLMRSRTSFAESA